MVYRDAFLTEDTVWHGLVRVEGGVTVASQATLTVEPGTVIRFAGNGAAPGMDGVLLVEGRLVARGSADRPVIFTSAFAAARAGDWQGIVFLGTDKKNLLEHCRLEGGTTGIDASFSTLTMKNTLVVGCETGIRCQDCLLAATGGGIQKCGTGMSFGDSETDLREITVSGNHRGIVAARSSLALTGAILDGNEGVALAAGACRLAIVSSAITANGNGLALTECEGSVTANRISGNRGYGVRLGHSRLRVNANGIEQNAGNGLEVEDGAAIAWDNALAANGGYDCYNGGSEDFRAIGNWWGGGDAAAVGARVYDRQRDAQRGRVLYWPTLRERPEMRP